MKVENGKIIFFDIDGTLISMGGEVSPKLQEGLATLQANGHKICIATGRSLDSKVENLKKLNWNGYVLANGAYGEYDNELIVCETIDKRRVKEFVEYTNELPEVGIIFEGNDGAFTTKDDAEIALKIMLEITKGKLSREAFFSYFKLVEDLSEIKNVNKMMYFNGEQYAKGLIERFGDDLDFLPNSITQSSGWDTAEIMKKGVTKATGIEKIIKRAGYERADVIAFGDGYNDIAMIQYAGIGVAMGNGVDQLKQTADFVTDTQVNDGVFKMLQELKLI